MENSYIIIKRLKSLKNYFTKVPVEGANELYINDIKEL